MPNIIDLIAIRRAGYPLRAHGDGDAHARPPIRDGNAVIVVHGIDYNHNGIYDNVLDRSELSNSLPGEATAPALCGPLAGGQTASAPGGSGGVYTASLHVYPEAVGDNVARRWLLCQVA